MKEIKQASPTDRPGVEQYLLSDEQSGQKGTGSHYHRAGDEGDGCLLSSDGGLFCATQRSEDGTGFPGSGTGTSGVCRVAGGEDGRDKGIDEKL